MSFVDIEAEKKVLSFLILKLDYVSKYSGKIKLSIFSDKKTQNLYRSIFYYFTEYNGLLNRDSLEKLLNLQNVSAELQEEYLLLFDELSLYTVDESEFKFLLDLLKKLEEQRSLFELGSTIASKVTIVDPSQLRGEILTKIMELEQSGNEIVYRGSIKDNIIERIQNYVHQKEHPELYKGSPYGFRQLDELTGGAYPGEFILVTGITGAGKTRLLFNLAFNSFKYNKNVMYFTIEMPKAQISRMFDSRFLKLSYTGIKQSILSPEDEERYKRDLHNLSECKGDFFIVDSPRGVTPELLLSEIRAYRKLHKVDLIVVDYLNLMNHPNTKLSREEMLGALSKELKAIARLENIPLITAAQISSKESSKQSTASAGTELVAYSDQIAQNSDLVLMVDRSDKTLDLQHSLLVRILKCRDKSVASFEIGAQWEYNFLGDFSELLEG